MAHLDAFSPRTDIANLQQEQLNLLLDALLPANRFYAKKFAEAGLTRADIATCHDLRRLPFTTKAELVADQEKNPPHGTNLTYPLANYTRYHQTSGTQGIPLRWLDTPASWERMKRCWTQIFAMVNVEPGKDRLCFPFSFGPFLGFWTAFEATDDIACLKLAMGGMSSLARLRLLLDNQATIIFCTPTYALHLAQVALENGIALGPSTPGFKVRALIVAGEPGGSIPATKARIEEAWQARVFDHHGLTEVGPMSIECPHAPGGLHILECDYFIEVIDPATGTDVPPGELGELVVTTLGRLGNPVLRYRTGDLVRVDPHPCSCGRSFMRLAGGILGRTDDMIMVRGNNFYPSALEEVIRRFREVAEYRIEIDTSTPLAELRVEIEPVHNVSPTDYPALGTRLTQALRDDLLFRAEVVVVAPDTLPRFEMKARRIQKKTKDSIMLRTIILGLGLFGLAMSAQAADWYNWRGPWQNGVSPETNLPDKWSPDPKDADNNLIWKAPYGCRSTPLIMNGRVFLINHLGDKETVQERVMCLDANTGKFLWEYKFNVWHTDIVTTRLGWTNLAGDPKTGNIYAQGTQGTFLCFDREGKILWQHSLTEEYGRISGYGGRVTSPTVADDLVIVGMLNSSWGDQAKGGCRFLALDKLTGAVVWWSEPGTAPKDTFYSVPVVHVINGQKLLISGGADGGIYAMKLNTGETVWTYTFGNGAINCSPVVMGSYVYIGHDQESPGSNELGLVICLDAAQVEKGEPKLVWKKEGLKARYGSPAIDLQNGLLYIPDEVGRLVCLDAKSGKQLWRFKIGLDVRASPVLADGKIFIGELSSKFHILKPSATKCERLHEHYIEPEQGIADVEINGSVAIANGRIFIPTSEGIYCIGRKDAKPAPEPIISEAPTRKGKGPDHLQIMPVDVVLYSGESATFKARAFDEYGNFLKEVTAEWSLPVPPIPKGAKQGPPALKGQVAGGKLTVDQKLPAQQGYVLAKAEGLTAQARVRVAPQLPYVQDFSKVPDGAVPAGWINTQGKFLVATVNGEKVLRKVNDKGSPLVARGNGFIGMPTLKDYTIESDVMGGKVGDDLPDMGIVANRYSLVLAGNIQKLRITSWEALPRIDKTINYPWQPNVWYRLKLTTEVTGDNALIKGKCWKRGETEPAAWTLQVSDPRANREGSPALYGYVTGIPNEGPGTDIFYANVNISPNKK